MTEDRLFTTPEVCAATGATYRQADYWCRVGVTPTQVAARGSGSKRLYTPAQMLAVRLTVVLAALGAQCPTVAAAVRSVLDNDDLWDHLAVVHPDGSIDSMVEFDRLAGAYIVDMPAERRWVLDKLAVAA